MAGVRIAFPGSLAVPRLCCVDCYASVKRNRSHTQTHNTNNTTHDTTSTTLQTTTRRTTLPHLATIMWVTTICLLYPRETPPHTSTARAQPPAAQRRRHSRPHHHRHEETQSHSAPTSFKRPMLTPTWGAQALRSALRHVDAGPSTKRADVPHIYRLQLMTEVPPWSRVCCTVHCKVYGGLIERTYLSVYLYLWMCPLL